MTVRTEPEVVSDELRPAELALGRREHAEPARRKIDAALCCGGLVLEHSADKPVGVIRFGPIHAQVAWGDRLCIGGASRLDFRHWTHRPCSVVRPVAPVCKHIVGQNAVTLE